MGPLIDRQPWALLEPMLAATELETGFLESAGIARGERLTALRRYGQLLLEWNRNVSNLISKHDEGRLVQRHLKESLEPAHQLAATKCASWLDFGSGAGLPAIPLAIAGVGSSWTVVESRRTKTLFMRKALIELGLRGFDVRLGRLEVLIETGELGRSFDAFTSRATLALGPTLELASKIVRPGGYAFLWKGSRGKEEIAKESDWQPEWEIVDTIAIGEENTSVIVFRLKQ